MLLAGSGPEAAARTQHLVHALYVLKLPIVGGPKHDNDACMQSRAVRAMPEHSLQFPGDGIRSHFKTPLHLDADTKVQVRLL